MVISCCCSLSESCLTLCGTLWAAARQDSLSFTISWSLLKLMSIESMMSSSYLILCWPLLLLPSIFPSIRVFSSKSALHIRWPENYSCSFSIRPSTEYSGLISSRIPLGLTGLISLLPKGLSRPFLWCVYHKISYETCISYTYIHRDYFNDSLELTAL